MQAQNWNKWEMVAFNTLEQMEKSQQLTVSSCSMPGSVLGAIHGSEGD